MKWLVKMPNRIAKIVERGKRITIISLSKDWYTITPWIHDGKVVPYVSKYVRLSDSRNVLFTYWYIGPIGIVSGKWVG